MLTLSPLAVRPDVQRQGVGSALVVEALRRADATGAALVTLEGSPAYYPRFGFRDARTLGVTIDLPDWAPRDAGQVYLLSAYDPAVRGRLVYPPAFAASDGGLRRLGGWSVVGRGLVGRVLGEDPVDRPAGAVEHGAGRLDLGLAAAAGDLADGAAEPAHRCRTG